MKKSIFYNYANQKDSKKLKEFLKVKGNQELFARAWLDGYEVEKEKWYFVKIKGMTKDNRYLKYNSGTKHWYFSGPEEFSSYHVKHTRKELEEAGFGEVFNSPLFEVEEVAE